MKILIGIVMLAAAVLGVAIYKKCRGLERIDRTIAATMPALAALLAIEAFLIILTQPGYDWNNMRLARTFALYGGMKIYPGVHATGSIVGTLHTPMSHILFWPATLAATPDSAIIIGSILAFLLVLGPLLWLHWPRKLTLSRSLLFSCYALVACGCILLRADTSGGMRFCAFRIHTDAAAICFAMLAGGVIYRSKSSYRWGCLLLSSAFAILSLGSKQTMAPVLPALCFFLLIADGLKTALRYLLCLLGCGLAFCGLLFYWFRPAQDLLFNLLTLASHRPYNGESLMGAFRPVLADAMLQGLPVVICLLLFLLYWHFYEHDSNNGWRKLFSTERWIVFPLIGLFLAPVCIKAQMTFGGDLNHVGIFCFFLALGLTLGLSRWMNDEASATKAAAAKLLTTTLIVVCLPGVIVEIPLLLFRQIAHPTDLTLAYQYDRKHPGRAYFPRYPLAEYYAEHRLYHSDGALLDREVTGHGASPAQFASGIPKDVAVIALSKGQPKSGALQNYLAGWPQINDPELPGWVVYQRPSAGGLTPQQ